jgi:hypothetical protein
MFRLRLRFRWSVLHRRRLLASQLLPSNFVRRYLPFRRRRRPLVQRRPRNSGGHRDPRRSCRERRWYSA